MPDTSLSQTATPPANVYEGNGQLSVALPIPGAHREHVTVTVNPRDLVIDAVCKYPQVSQHYHRHEWKVGGWHAEVPLPAEVDPARARATLNLGVLVVMAPLGRASEPSHTPPVE